MGRGFLAGIFWGGLVGAALLAVSSQVMERQVLSLPQPEAVPVEVPAGTEFDQARPESEPVVPEAGETTGRAVPEGVAGVTPPEDMVETPPAFDTSSLEVPQPNVEGPGGLGEVPEVAEDLEIAVTGPGSDAAPSEGTPALSAPEAPATAPETVTEAPAPAPAETGETTEAAPEVAVEPEPAPTPETSEPVAPVTEIEQPVAPDASGTAEAPAPQTPVAPEPSPAPETGDAPVTVVTVDGGDSEFFKPIEEIGQNAPSLESERLPRIGQAPATEDSALPQVITLEGEDDDAPELLDLPSDDDPLPDGAPALLAHRMPFETEPGLPLLSVVLIHEGAAALSGADLDRVPETVAIAVNAGQSRAGDIAAAYRAAGREVVMIPSLPQGATPQDVEVALRVNFETIPEAVAVMDSSGESFQSDRSAVAQIVDVVAATGHGLITFPRGLNTAHQRAGRAGVPTGLIFRDIDGEGESPDQVRRAMDRAAFRARQDEAVILVGRTQPKTIGALIEWMLGNRAASVSVAPISAALLAN